LSPARAVVLGSRREARERALSLLYEADSKQVDPGAILDDLPVPPDPFVVDLVRGVQAEQARIDELISAHAIGWTMDRMPVVDRVLLRMATYELLDRPDIPTGAVISEAVDLAGQYSTDESGRFVNGVLATIAAIARDEPDPPIVAADPDTEAGDPGQPW
jgi:N utilization substance protein B